MDYIFDSVNKYYSAVPKDNPKDKVEIEIGDSKDTEKFQPQLKIMRWDNEVNFSLRLFDDLPDRLLKNVVYDGEKITWEKGDYKAVFYDKPDASEEGGYEFEIHLGRKPPVNKLTFTINTKELEYFYQPALTQEEIDEGSERPENVVGSYAVYYKNCPANYVDGKEYKVGKAFHIYRPHAVDSVGNSTWGDVSIDEVAGTMTISVPQDFLNSAVYPVIVDPTFGYTTMGASYQSTAADTFRGVVYSAPESGTVTKITGGGLDNSSPFTCEIKGVLVTSSALNIVTNGVGNASGSYFPGFATGWLDSTYSTSPSIVSGTSYVIGMVLNNAAQATYDVASNLGRDDTTNSFTGPTDPTDATTVSCRYSIYATYTASGGGSLPVPKLSLLGVGS